MDGMYGVMKLKVRCVCDFAPESGCPDSKVVFVDELIDWVKENTYTPRWYPDGKPYRVIDSEKLLSILNGGVEGAIPPYRKR